MATAPNCGPRTCGACDKQLGRRNATGYCKAHFHAVVDRVAMGASISAARKRMFAENPEKLAERRALMRRIAVLPQTQAARRATVCGKRIWERGVIAARHPDARRKAAASCRATKLAWCPPHLREQYTALRKMSDMTAAEARAMILDQHEADMQRWRRANGLVPEPEVPGEAAPAPLPRGPKVKMPDDTGFLDRCLAVLAALAGVDEAELRTAGINRKLSRHRQAACWALKQHYGDAISYPAIGRALGGLDHGSVICAYRRAEEMRLQDPVLGALCRAALAA